MEKTSSIFRKIIIWIGLVIVTFLTVTSFFQKCSFHWDETGQVLPEMIYYEKNHFWILGVLTLVLVFGLKKYQGWKSWSLKKMELLFFFSVIIVSIVWIAVSAPVPVADDMMVLQSAEEIACGNYASLMAGGYLYSFTHQLGIVFILEKIYVVFGTYTVWIFRIGNVTALCLIYLCFIKSERYMNFSEEAKKISIICMAGFIVPIFYTTFVYGNTIGLSFSIWAIYYLLKYLEDHKIKNVIIMIALAVTACVFKTNYIIPMLASVIILLLNGIQKKRWINVLICLALFGCNIGAQTGIEKYYEQKIGAELGGTSKILWVTMGTEEGPFASGWYNLSLGEMLNESQESKEKQTEVAIEHIKNSAQQFKTGERNVAGFYYRKIVSQWNEPTFEALWINYHQQNQYEGKMGTVLQSVYKGKLNYLIRNWMNWWHIVILLFSMIGLWSMIKNDTYGQCALILTVIGGFFFHILWEGKSQYIWTYYILLIPFCALGIEKVTAKRYCFERREKMYEKK